MASGVNKVILIGNLGSDPEIRHLESGSTVANFNIATSESYTSKNGERITQTEWHRLELWDGLARIAEQYLKKGNTIYVEGKLRTESWQDKDGVSRSTTRVRVTNLTMLGGGSGSSGGSSDYNGAPSSSATPVPPQRREEPVPPAMSSDGDDDELPF
ncbi:single-strand DNA-binding protein [Catalinimonas alkaloidigena]|uniref:Single-stranded DNA-binding protein n=1 Tax=Catalinimonas alkaloidigena TaxID=1075417 RepID=A0A1G9ETR7_9BACT|nr:single-stranded DNA-binding protein [Catalinimonas alkaloidigena]SDK79428.1 single-strand DNA-binding protein [Catalinimonas alkaloidigena]